MDKFLLELVNLVKFRFKELDKYYYNILYILIFLSVYIIVYSAVFSFNISFTNIYQLIYTCAILELSRIFICTLIFLKKGKQDNPKYYFKYLFNFLVLLAIFKIPAMTFTALSVKFGFLLFIFDIWVIIIFINGIRFFYHYSYVEIILKYIIYNILYSIIFLSIFYGSIALGIVEPSGILIDGQNIKEICKIYIKDNASCNDLY